MQLRKAEAFGVLDDHDRGIRHVNADLDDRRSHEQTDFTVLEGEHDGVFFRSCHAPVHQADILAEPSSKALVALIGGHGVGLLGFLDERADQ